MKKSNVIEELHGRLDKLEMWQQEEADIKEKQGKGKKKKSTEDEDVCPKCGGDLVFVEDGIVYCPKCKDFYEEEEE